MDERLAFVLGGLIHNKKALSMYMGREDLPKTLLSANRAIYTLVEFIRKTYEQHNICITFPALKDFVANKYNIPKNRIEGDAKFERYTMFWDEATEAYENGIKKSGDDYIDDWKAEFRWAMEDYAKRRRLQMSHDEHLMMKQECFGNNCGKDDCPLKKHCRTASKKKQDKLDYAQRWRENEDQLLRNLLKERRRVTEYNYSRNKIERLNRYRDKYRKRQSNPGGTLGIPFSLPTLNKWCDGWCDSRVYCVAARTGQGKSAFALQESCHAWLHSNINVLYFNLEMPREELEERLDAGRLGISFSKILKANWDNDEEYETFVQKVMQEEERENEFVILDTPSLTLAGLSYYMRQYYNRWGSNFIVVLDNLNVMTFPSNMKRNEGANAIAVEFHSLCKEYKIPGMMLCQLNRDAENAQRIQSKHFRDSDQIGDIFDATFALLPFGVNKKKLVLVKGRSFKGDKIFLWDNLDRMRLIEIVENEGYEEDAEDEDEVYFA